MQVYCDHGLWSIPKFAYFGRNFLIWYSIFGRETPFANHVKFRDMLPETSQSSAFWDMGVNSHLKWLLLFSPDEAGELGRHQSSVNGDGFPRRPPVQKVLWFGTGLCDHMTMHVHDSIECQNLC